MEEALLQPRVATIVGVVLRIGILGYAPVGPELVFVLPSKVDQIGPQALSAGVRVIIVPSRSIAP